MAQYPPPSNYFSGINYNNSFYSASLFVLKSGDTMTGNLIAPNINVKSTLTSGNITASAMNISGNAVDTIALRNTALLSYPTNTDMNSAIASYLIPYSTTDQMNSAISSSLTVYSTTNQMNSAISTALTPYSTTNQMNSAISTALTPYSTTNQILALNNLTNYYNKTDADARYLRLTGGNITGNLGIGTTNNPNNNILQVGNAGRLKISNGNTDYSLIGTIDTDGALNTRIVISGNQRTGFAGNIEYYATGTGNHIFYNNDTNTERMRINMIGNIGIGTIDALTRLHVQHNSTSMDGDSGGLFVYNPNNSANNTSIIGCGVAGGSASRTGFSTVVKNVAGGFGWTMYLNPNDTTEKLLRFNNSWNTTGNDRFTIANNGQLTRANDVWHKSFDLVNRELYANGGATSFHSGNGVYYFQNTNQTINRITIDDAGKLTFNDEVNTMRIQLYNGYGFGIEGGTLRYNTAGNHRFYSNNNQVLNIDSAGNFSGGANVFKRASFQFTPTQNPQFPYNWYYNINLPSYFNSYTYGETTYIIRITLAALYFDYNNDGNNCATMQFVCFLSTFAGLKSRLYTIFNSTSGTTIFFPNSTTLQYSAPTGTAGNSNTMYCILENLTNY